MITQESIFICFFVCMLFTCVLYVTFGQVTVRKLRKNPKTKKKLGVEFVSGWDILNVAQALSIPKSWSRKMEKSPLSGLNANYEVVHENTNKFDIVLAKIFTLFFISTGCFLLIMVSYDLLT